MSVIKSVPDQAFGTAISENVSGMTGKEVSDAQVFVALRRLERQGFIASCPAPNSKPSTRTRGRPRKYYELTASGERALDAAGAYTRDVQADLRSSKEHHDGREKKSPSFAPVVG